ncbi:5'-3' exonuclease [Granulicoccus sp. GXG6511]|uniref:5'-3' exonuclease n=1 Tax=Granulicoccus sp. GXG6511 TaxID=3381351 RepID=UPI003D7ECA79
MTQPADGGARLMLLDTASLYFRAFYGMPDSLRTPDGQPVNAVRGLLDFIARLIRDHDATHLVACWDNDWRPQWRVDLLPSYKTHRVAVPAPGSAAASVIGAGGVGAESGVAEEAPDTLAPQVPWIMETLTALGLSVVGVDGFEADDVIATLATRFAPECERVDVVTGDRDLFQLVDDQLGIRCLYTARGMSNLAAVDAAWVRDKYGIEPQRYADFAALRGDTSDGIPGVAGVGEKTAAVLVNEYADLPALVAAAEDPASRLTKAQRTRVLAGRDYLAFAGDVVRTRRDLDVAVALNEVALPQAPADLDEFAALTDRLGLGSSAERIVAALSRDSGAARH